MCSSRVPACVVISVIRTLIFLLTWRTGSAVLGAHVYCFTIHKSTVRARCPTVILNQDFDSGGKFSFNLNVDR